MIFLVLFISVQSFYDVYREMMIQSIHFKDPHAQVDFQGKQPWGEVRTLPLDPRPQISQDSISFSGVFANGTVLQREPNLAALFGMAPPKSEVKIALWEHGREKVEGTVKSDNSGQWKWILPRTFPAGGNYTVIAGNAWMTNVTFGDVWYCSGQSNMELAMHFTLSHNESWAAYQNGSYRNIRLYSMPHTNLLDSDRTWVIPPHKTGWKVNFTKEDLSEFYSPCWYFAQELTNQMGEKAPPIGLVGTAIGGTMVEAWARNHTLDKCNMNGHAYNTSVCRDKKGYNCGSLFNGMVAPWLNVTIKGVLWYQGENNMNEDKGNIKNDTGYACMFNIMKDQWREYWSVEPGTSDPDLGFGIVTLAPYGDEGGKNMANMRWAQTLNYGVLPNPMCKKCFMAQAYDLGDPWESDGCQRMNTCTGWSKMVAYSATRTPFFMGSIHPRVKFEVGRRLAVAAMGVVYGHEDVSFTGPTISWCKFKTHPSHVDFTIQFDADFMNPGGIKDGKQYEIYVYGEAWKQMSDHVMQVNVNGSWLGVGLPSQDSRDGQIKFTYATEDGSRLPDLKNLQGLRYAWDQSGRPACCPGLNNGYLPCPPRSCPIMQKFNTTFDKDNKNTGLEEGLPANPFLANLVWDGEDTGHCECIPPQVCS